MCMVSPLARALHACDLTSQEHSKPMQAAIGGVESQDALHLTDILKFLLERTGIGTRSALNGRVISMSCGRHLICVDNSEVNATAVYVTTLSRVQAGLVLSCEISRVRLASRL